MGKVSFLVRGISAYRAADKLKRAQIAVLSLKKTQKNAVILTVQDKDSEKAFAILSESCYNVEKITYRGVSRFVRFAAKRAGLFVGILLFCLSVSFAETRVLRICVTGNGSSYRSDVERILGEQGVHFGGSFPSDVSPIVQAVLALPRVSFCSVKGEGGVLTVEVEVSDDNVVWGSQPFRSPCAGEIVSMTVIRGTPLVKEGDSVNVGDVLVDCCAAYGETVRPVIVIARTEIAYPVRAVYPAADEAGALLSAELEYGTGEYCAEQTQEGWLVTGTAKHTASMNMT